MDNGQCVFWRNNLECSRTVPSYIEKSIWKKTEKMAKCVTYMDSFRDERKFEYFEYFTSNINPISHGVFDRDIIMGGGV